MPPTTSRLTRRSLILGTAALAGCGFRPAYGPAGGAGRLTGQVALAPPGSRAAYLFNRRVEERLGRASGGRYLLRPGLSIAGVTLGETSTGSTTRVRLDGRASYQLVDVATNTPLLARQVDAFTGYSVTGPNVSTRTSQRDAEERLMIILADQVIDQLLLEAPDLPA